MKEVTRILDAISQGDALAGGLHRAGSENRTPHLERDAVETQVHEGYFTGGTQA